MDEAVDMAQESAFAFRAMAIAWRVATRCARLVLQWHNARLGSRLVRVFAGRVVAPMASIDLNISLALALVLRVSPLSRLSSSAQSIGCGTGRNCCSDRGWRSASEFEVRVVGSLVRAKAPDIRLSSPSGEFQTALTTKSLLLHAWRSHAQHVVGVGRMMPGAGTKHSARDAPHWEEHWVSWHLRFRRHWLLIEEEPLGDPAWRSNVLGDGIAWRRWTRVALSPGAPGSAWRVGRRARWKHRPLVIDPPAHAAPATEARGPHDHGDSWPKGSTRHRWGGPPGAVSTEGIWRRPVVSA